MADLRRSDAAGDNIIDKNRGSKIHSWPSPTNARTARGCSIRICSARNLPAVNFQYSVLQAFGSFSGQDFIILIFVCWTMSATQLQQSKMFNAYGLSCRLLCILIPKFSSAQFLVGHLILAFGGNGMVNLRNLSVVSVMDENNRSNIKLPCHDRYPII